MGRDGGHEPRGEFSKFFALGEDLLEHELMEWERPYYKQAAGHADETYAKRICLFYTKKVCSNLALLGQLVVFLDELAGPVPALPDLV